MEIMSAEVREALDNLSVLQPMICLSAERLDGLRTQCSTSVDITQQEIRTLEGKLIKLFSYQLVAKRIIPISNLTSSQQELPSLSLWLQVVGLTTSLSKILCSKVSSLESLKDKSEHEIRVLMTENNANDEEIRRLTRALTNLKRYTEVIRSQSESNSKNGVSLSSDVSELYWDSWDMNKVTTIDFLHSAASSPRLNTRSRSARNSVPSEDYLGTGISPQNGNTHACSTTPCTPVTTKPPSSLTSPAYSPGSHPDIYSPTNSSVFSPSSSTSPASLDPGFTPPSTPPVKPKDKKFPMTPPAKKKHTALTTQPQTTGTLTPDSFPLTKSKSHESQLGNRIESSPEINLASSNGDTKKVRPWLFNFTLSLGTSLESVPYRKRLPTEPTGSSGWDSMSVLSTLPLSSSPHSGSPLKSPPLLPNLNNDTLLSDESDSLLSNPKSATLQVPRSPRTPTIARSMGHMISHRFAKMLKVATCDYCFKQMIIGLKCKECKFKCHRDCEPKVPASCGLPAKYIEVFVQKLQEGEANIARVRKLTKAPQNTHIQPFPDQNSSSNTSSCNSSTPSSPAFITGVNPSSATTPAFSSAPSTGSLVPLFTFPEVLPKTMSEMSLETRSLVDSAGSCDLSSTIKSNDSDRTVSQTSGSTDSENTIAHRVDSQDSQISDGEGGERNWPRQNSLSNREWDIPFDELQLGKEIGTGHFGKVYKGHWHGDVAIKVLSMISDKETFEQFNKEVEQFKQEVAMFRKTRHENLVLFMGACMKPPTLAIVTSQCKGNSLYTHIHLLHDKFNMNKSVLIAQQISQGMGYLHARGIIHKDLKSKNIFLESGKVVITDFGLFSVTKLCHGSSKGDSLSIPVGWLCYLSPELIVRLKPSVQLESDLPFSTSSDIYAFGTLWYELLCGEWPFKGLPPEAIIWQVGSGIRHPLPTLFSRDIKEIMMECWSTKCESRPDFSSLYKSLEKLPKKRLARSPSHPINLSRSAESVF